MEDAVVKFIKKHAKTQWMLRWLAAELEKWAEEVGAMELTEAVWLQRAEIAFEDWRNNTQGGRG